MVKIKYWLNILTPRWLTVDTGYYFDGESYVPVGDMNFIIAAKDKAPDWFNEVQYVAPTEIFNLFGRAMSPRFNIDSLITVEEWMVRNKRHENILPN